MTPPQTLEEMLAQVAAGDVSPAAAAEWMRRHQIEEMGFATLDLQRQLRRRRPEVIFAEGKQPAQVWAIAERFVDAGQNVLVTRLTSEMISGAPAAIRGVAVHVAAEARLARIEVTPRPRRDGVVGVLAAGTSDLPVAEEAAQTAEALGSVVERAYDVGVAGLHRLLKRGELLVKARVLIVVAGMEGALPSVVSGLTQAPVIAVPTSVGYGANFGGLSALLTMINSCSPGVGVVNIDNGFGAGYLADMINGVGTPET